MARRRGEFAVLAILCIMSGVVLMLDNIGIITGIWRLWPIFPFFLGLGGIWFSGRTGKRDLLTLGIGAFLILSSILFFILNFTSWKLLATAWPVFIGIFGITILIVAYFSRARQWLAISGLFSIFLATIFFMVFAVNAKLWPVSLVLFGIWILLIPKRSP